MSSLPFWLAYFDKPTYMMIGHRNPISHCAMLKKIINLVLYGNFWIALCAVSMVWQSRLLLGGHAIAIDYFSCFVFFSTLFLYAIHRIVGITRLKDFFEVERYHVISSFRHHIIIYAMIAAVACLYCFFFLDRRLQMALVLPGILSLAYVIPFWGNRKRLRDVNFVKIFVIALVWAYITVILPALEMSKAMEPMLALMYLERTVFIFAITVPFDIRDMKVDTFNKVQTLPTRLGLNKSIHLALGAIGAFMLFAGINFLMGNYSLCVLGALWISGLTTGLLIWKSTPARHDYFYTGLMDGTMVLQFMLLYACVVL